MSQRARFRPVADGYNKIHNKSSTVLSYYLVTLELSDRSYLPSINQNEMYVNGSVREKSGDITGDEGNPDLVLTI